jgi:dGTP triphosphohydrolase
MLFDFFKPVVHKGYKSDFYMSDDIRKMLYQIKDNVSKKILSFDDKFEITHVKKSDKKGFVKVLPSSKYHYLLEKYSKINSIKDKYFIDKYFNNFHSFRCDDDFQERLNNNYQDMRVGRFVKRMLGDSISNVDVENFVNEFKKF